MQEIASEILLSVVIPVYGDGKQLLEITQRIDRVIAVRNWPQAQIVLIDDCGSDSSWGELTALSNARSNTVAIKLSRNFGQHNALMCGFHHVTGDIVVTIDDDLQQEPESIPDLVETLQNQKLDVVYGVYESKKHAVGRNIGSTLVNFFYKKAFKTKTPFTSFRAVQRQFIEEILRYELNFTFIDGLLAWNTTQIGSVVIPHHERATGKSGYTISKLFSLAMNVFTNFSLIPLQSVSLLGFTSAFMGVALAIWYIAGALLGLVTVPGYASTIVVVLVLGGVQLLSLGIMGEYIGRLHMNVNRKPQFSIRKIIKNQEESDCPK